MLHCAFYTHFHEKLSLEFCSTIYCYIINCINFFSFLTENDICCLLICEKSYAAVLAFSFLDDIKQGFLQQYHKVSIESAIRPYSFIEFGRLLFFYFMKH